MNPQIRYATRSQHVHLPKEHTETEKVLAARNVISLRWTQKFAAEKMDCAESTVYRWILQLNNGQCMHEKGGRPAFINAKQKKKVIAEVTETVDRPVKISKRRFSKMLQDAADTTSMSKKNLSKRYVRDFEVKNDIKEGNAEVIDNPHFVALNDPRHALSFAVMHNFLRKRVPDGLFVTLDKTRFDLPKSEQEKARAIFLFKRPQCVKCAQPNKKISQGNCSVQLFAVVSDGGKLADLVYLVKDNTMPLDSVDIHSVPGLNTSTSPGSAAYLIFYGTASPNKDESLEWLIYNIVIPFIAGLRKDMEN